MAQCVDKEREGRRGLSAARVEEVIAGIGRAPFRKNTLKTALGNVSLGEAFGYIGKSASCKGSIEELRRAVESQLTFYTHSQA